MKKLLFFWILFLVLISVWYYLFVKNNNTATNPLVEVVDSSSVSSIQNLSNRLGDPQLSWSELLTQKEQESRTNIETLREVAFIRSLLGDLQQAEKDLDIYCKNNNSITSVCQKTRIDFEILNPVDEKGNQIAGVQFEVLGKDGSVSQDKATSVDLYKNTVFRTRVAKKGFTDFIQTERFVTWPNEAVPSKKISQSPLMIAAQATRQIWPGDTFSVTTKHYTFSGNYSSFIARDGGEISGPIDVYFFDLGRDIPEFANSSLLALDVFDSREVMEGFGMSTFGMPLVKAYAWDRELDIDPEHPIRVVWKIQDHDDYLLMIWKTNQEAADIYKKIPAWTKVTLENSEQLGMPPFWRLDKETGFWWDDTYTILDSEGTVETFLY